MNGASVKCISQLIVNIMKMRLLLIYLLFSLANGDVYNVGYEDQFNFSNVVVVGNIKNASTLIGYQFLSSVTVGVIWGKGESRLLKIQIQNPVIHTIPESKPVIAESLETPFYAWRDEGRIKAIYFSSLETFAARNFKKAIGSLFQYQVQNGIYEEVDPSGLCMAKYRSHTATQYHKTKENCQYDKKRVQRTEYPLQSSFNMSHSTYFNVSARGSLETLTSREFVKYMLNAYDQFGIYYESVMQLFLVNTTKRTISLEGSSISDIIKEMSLESETLLLENYSSSCFKHNCEDIIPLFKKYQQILADYKFGTEKYSMGLIELLDSARKATKEEWLRILNAKSSKKYKAQILDILGAVQTVASHEAAKSEFKHSSDEDTFLAERYFQALAIATRPKKEIIEDVMELALSEPKCMKFTDSLIQSLASMTRRYAHVQTLGYESETVQLVSSFFIKRFQECVKENCKLQYIRGLQNLQSPNTAEMLLKIAQEASRTISVAAMKALRSFSMHLWNNEFKAKFEDIFFQVSRNYDSSARILALDILLDMKPNYHELVHLLQFLKSTDKSVELKQYLIQRLQMLSEQCASFASQLKSALESDPTINNYHILVPKGLSTALNRKFSTAPTFNASINSLQEMNGGILKRGIVDLTLEVADEKMSLFTLGLYAAGLSSFVSSNEDDVNDGDEEETTAGMELSVQGSVMRPLVFFNGKGELMGHVWSGTASESTPAYQATTLLQDNEECFRSHNGAALRFTTTGAISIDLNGQVTMSLWGRNAQSKVEQNIGIAMTGTLWLDTGLATMEVTFTTTQEPQLHLTSFLDFSNDPVLCLQLVQPENTMIEQFVMNMSLVGLKQNVACNSTKLHYLNGLTHAINRKNSEMCSMIAKS